MILAGCKLGLGFALIVVVGTEFVAAGSRDGVGVLIWESWQVLNIESMYVGLFLTAALGWFLSTVLDELEIVLLPWRASRPGQSGLARPERTVAGVPLRIWWRAARPFSFTATIIPVVLGAAIAPTTLPPATRLGLLLLTLAGTLGVHAGANLINDYFDHRNGLDTSESLGIGGAIQLGLLTDRQVFAGGVAAFSLGIIVGLVLVVLRGPTILLLGLLGVPLAYFYTGAPFRLAYYGLGEILVGIFMGPVMILGSYYVQTGAFALAPALLSLPVAFLVAAIMHINNLRDIETDRARGKWTLANLIGPVGATWEYYFLVLGAYVVVSCLALAQIIPLLTLLSLLTLPLAISLIRRVAASQEPRALNTVLRQTAMLHLRFGMLLILGLLLPLLLQR